MSAPFGRREPSSPASTPSQAPPAPSGAASDRERIARGRQLAEYLINEAVRLSASDIHIKTDEPIRVRAKNKDMVPIVSQDISGEQVMDIIYGTAPRMDMVHEFLERSDADYSFGTQVARVRVNAYRSGGRPGMVMRVINTRIPTFAQLGLDEHHMMDIAHMKEGLVLVTGPTGSGKSTTLASILNWIIQNKSHNIVTIEDPIETVFSSSRSMIVQREIGPDTASFAAGVRAALRQDPDVILIGEMRDRETVEAAMKAAQTGHLVFSTLHTQSAPKTIERIINFYPVSEQHIIRQSLSETIQAVMSQRLLRAGEGRLMVQEIMRRTPAICDAIAKKDNDIEEIMENDRKHMITASRRVAEHVATGKLSLSEAEEQVANISTVKLLLTNMGFRQKTGSE